MSAPDLLREATRALREVDVGESDQADNTRERLVQSLEGRKKRRRVTAIVLTVFVATLTASTSLAALDGSLQKVIGDLMVVVESSEEPLEELDTLGNRSRTRALQGDPLQAESFPPPSEVEEPPPTESALEIPVDTLGDLPSEQGRIAQRSRPASPLTPSTPLRSKNGAPGAAEEVPTKVEQIEQIEQVEQVEHSKRAVQSTEPPLRDHPETHALYIDAHRAHFVEGNFRAALVSWNRYLAVAPNGQFALEARYNRAISLTRLGRKQSAIAALRPFAEGHFNGYRQQEAVELSAALEHLSRQPASSLPTN